MRILDLGQLKVSTETMKQQADEVDRLVASISGRFDEIKKYVEATKGHWVGSGGDAHRELYQAQVEEVDQIIRRLKEHPKDLREMAGIYESTEKSNVSAVQSLPTDVIS
jgi:WXG100 family type VII secretion target